MKFAIGDKVRFLNEKGEGIVTKIINKTTVGITIEDGFEIPYVISELVLIHEEPTTPASAKPNNQTTVKIEYKQQTNVQEKQGVYIAFSPERINDITHSDINAWLINHTSYKTIFTYSISKNNSFLTVESGTVGAFGTVLISTIDKSELDHYSNSKIDILFFNDKEHEPQHPISEYIKLKSVKFYKENTFIENNFIPEKALIINVFNLNGLIEEEKEKPKMDLSKFLFQKQTHSNTPKKSKPHASNDSAYEIDLHIEELLENYTGMSNAAIIQTQLKHFQKVLDKAISEHCRKLVVIHGVGNGRLKQEVRSIISSYNNLRFYDASYAKYGFGATEIVIS